MTKQELYGKITERFLALPQVKELSKEQVTIRAKALSPSEAIGVPERKDYPILTGKDVMIEADYKGFKGQAFTDAPVEYSGTLQRILEMPFAEDAHARGLLIASINAVMSYLGLSDRTVHCRNGRPKQCGREMALRLKERYGNPRILLVGYQPSILENLVKTFSEVRALDLNPENIGQTRFGIPIEDGADCRPAVKWAELILCTGSTVCNGTLADYLDVGREVLFYGTTLAGVATLLELPRICFADP
jgi:uncharacterized protein (DUF4213/DUF364 family)